ncbi:hypothetical protein Xen7305DRAFT_00048770 [Xenococcus sp. PCC 7305]|uniref:hypothetical protein n=1 Tax=Xenococcus sp. PCC 7305 TaxID=102125 RepID=UPI0002ACEB4C|nr:hypothetical protein [Xenococcus sp. PCC 7305]ELS05137.1 hypothetical protein Xen7305DRAFT_00048770 [Xenococcus sp. PCC 7305]
MTSPIVSLEVITGNSSTIEAPVGFLKVPVDLNEEAGGKYIYLCYKRENDSTYISQLMLGDENLTPPSGYEKIDVDLNAGAGGDYIYLFYKKSSSEIPVYDIVIQSTGGSSQEIPQYDGITYRKLNIDINEGAGGDHIHAYYLNEKPSPPVPNWTTGIPSELLNNPEIEYEISRIQLGKRTMLVRLQKLQIVEQRTIGAGIEFDYTQTKITGTTETETKTFSTEVGISAGFSFSKFNSEINIKLGYSTTSSYETMEQFITEEKLYFDPVGYDRTYAFCDVVDILRIVSIPQGHVLNELKSPTSISGIFLTNEHGEWGETQNQLGSVLQT